MSRMKSGARVTALLATLALLSACEHRVGTSGCEWARPIITTDADQITDATAEQILTLNETGARVCGW